MSKPQEVKRILVPLELHEAGEDLLYYAGELALAFGAELFLFHACKTADLTYTQQSRCIQTLRTFGERVLGREQRLNKITPPYDCIVRPGTMRENIETVAAACQADLILLEAQGEAARSRPAAIMELVSCPVLVVPTAAPFKKVKHMVFATDFTDQDKQLLLRLTGFAAQLQAKLTLVQVYTREERSRLSTYKAAMLELEKVLEGSRVCLKLLEEEDLLEGISEFAELVAADMLVLATQDSYLPERLLSSNYTKTMAYHTRIPVLAFRQLKKKPCAGTCANCVSKLREQQLQQTLPAAGTAG